MLQASSAPPESIYAKTEFSPYANKTSICIKSLYCTGNTCELELVKNIVGICSLMGSQAQVYPDTYTVRIRQFVHLLSVAVAKDFRSFLDAGEQLRLFSGY